MNPKNIRAKLIGSEDERAVSPVIGVILMVAITVILAAVIAAFVLDIGDLDDSAPQAQYDWESDSSNSNVSLTHTSGDDIDLSDVTVSVTVNESTESHEFDSGDFTAGDTIEFETNDSDDVEVSFDGESYATDGDNYEHDQGDPIEEVVVTWEADGSSSVIASYEP